MMFELFSRLREFYSQCSNRGWCRIINQEGKDFLTILSSETNFTQLPLNFCKYPTESLVSPKLSLENIKKLDRIISANDSSRVATLNQHGKVLIIRILNGKGGVIAEEKVKLYTIRTFPKSTGINFKPTVLMRTRDNRF